MKQKVFPARRNYSITVIAFHIIWIFSLCSSGFQVWSPTRKRNILRFQMSSMEHQPPFLSDPPPYLAIITEPDACVTAERAEETFHAISKAVGTNQVNIVSMRLSRPTDDKEFSETFDRALNLTKRLVWIADDDDEDNAPNPGVPRFRVVCSSDWVDLATEANAHGVHVKESHLAKIPTIRQGACRGDFVIGTSTHSVASAMESYATYSPDYYFVGTCFLTASHPEKAAKDLEGPTLPGKVRRALMDDATNHCPIVFAIGGIDETNCDIPVSHGADGVAVIRAILQASNPADVTMTMVAKMETALTGERTRIPPSDGS